MTKPILRSLLFVPGNSERKPSKSLVSGADAIIVDLEDSVMPNAKETARGLAAEFLENTNCGAEIWIRVNPLDTDIAISDINAVVKYAPAGIMLPKPDSAKDVRRLAKMIRTQEKEHKLPIGGIDVLPIATETAAAAQSLHTYQKKPIARLRGLTWGAEDLSTALGALTNVDHDGELSFVYKMVRARALIAARAAGVQPIEGVYTDFRNPEGLRKFASSAFRDGFSGMMAIHPAQVSVINECFTPSDQQVAMAQAIILAFDKNPGVGVVSVDGKMVDIPHLKQALNTVALRQTIDGLSS